MKRIIFILIIICGIAGIVISCSRTDNTPKTAAKIYYADKELNRLLPYDDEITESDSQHMAQLAIGKLIEGKDDNDKIRRILPKDKDCISLYVENDVAYVNLSSKIADKLPKSRDIERLLIYQIVDTLTSLKGIRFVKFTVDGAVHKEFMGFFDMRETYKFTYPE